MAKKSVAYTVMSGVATRAATSVSKKALHQTWRLGTGRKPPKDVADPGIAAWEAILWSALSAGVLALVKTLAQRGTARYYASSTGHLPAQLEHDREDDPEMDRTT